MRWITWAIIVGSLSSVAAQEASVAENDQVAEIIRTFGGRGAQADGSLPTPAEEAVKAFRVRDEFEISLLAGDDLVKQPLSASWDSKGRMWVVQYLQYQFPAGLKIVEYDNHLRAQFDRVPEPPPHGTPGADKVTVFEDTDGDGAFDQSTDVITGLNIATSAVTDRDGVWVANPPYLLYYPLIDDLKVGEPEVKLSGFGLEDTHAVMNSLKWGPDGWLYGACGSTTTGSVVDPASGERIDWQGQMIWRYHPEGDQFEIYAEGGGNTFSLEIDAKGRVFSGTNNGKTRGMYYPQGSYGFKNWGKHGPLTNPYAFGYFNHMKHEGDDRRFAQAFAINEHGALGEAFEGDILAPNSLHNLVWISDRHRDGSTWRTVDQENLIESDDRWFRPVWGGMGPDGAFYMADWSDSRLSHVRPVDDWDKGTGRLYRVSNTGDAKEGRTALPAGTEAGPLNLQNASSAELVANFQSPNRWLRHRSVLELGWRDEPVANLDDSLESLWTEHLLGRLTNQSALKWLKSSDPHVRRWVIRLIGDRKSIGDQRLATTIIELAKTEADVEVRSQLASSAKRLATSPALPILVALLGHDEDLDDPHLPLLNWWALEAHADHAHDVLAMITDDLWKRPQFRDVLANRLMRRWAMAGDLEAATAYLASAPDEEAEKILVTGLLEAFEGRPLPALPEALSNALKNSASEDELALRLKQNDPAAVAEAAKLVVSNGTPMARRLSLTKFLGQTGDPKVIAPLKSLLGQVGNSSLQRVALQSLAQFDDPSISTTILQRYGSTLPAQHDVRSTADRVLAGRADWAKAFLEQVDAWTIKARNISPDVVLLLRQHDDPEIDALVEKHWPTVNAQAAAEIVRLQKVLSTEASGDPQKGHEIYTQRCAVCHQLFDEGGAIGPDLTGYERDNLEFWLPAIVTPSLELREGYLGYVATLKDERVLLGMITDQGANTVTLRDLAGQESILDRAEIETLTAQTTSLMPAGLLGGLDDSGLRDLFAWLRSKGP